MTELSGKSPFDRFLFASLSEHDGMVLTVLSALARQDLDPHEEAARLAQLPRDEAAERLAAIIVKANSDWRSPYQAMATAAELLTLLPTGGSNSENNPDARIATAVGNQAQFMMWLTYGIVMAALVFNGGNAQRSAAPNQEPASTTMSSPTVPAVGINKVWSE